MEFKEESNRIFIGDGKRTLAEVKFVDEDGVYNINETFVDESLRGQGIAGQLVEQAVKKAQRENKLIKPTCPFAVKWFERHKGYEDILKK